VAWTCLLALIAQRFSTRSHGRCREQRPTAELVSGHTLAASARSVSSDGYGDNMSVQGSRASAGYGRRRLRLLLVIFPIAHTIACLLRWMSAQGGVQRSVLRRDSEARTGDDLPALSGSKNNPLPRAEGETVRVAPPTFRLPCQPGPVLLSGHRDLRGRETRPRRRDPDGSAARRVVDGR
jgi:hypothetical protein